MIKGSSINVVTQFWTFLTHSPIITIFITMALVLKNIILDPYPQGLLKFKTGPVNGGRCREVVIIRFCSLFHCNFVLSSFHNDSNWCSFVTLIMVKNKKNCKNKYSKLSWLILSFTYYAKDKLVKRDLFLEQAEVILKNSLGEKRAEKLLQQRR